MKLLGFIIPFVVFISADWLTDFDTAKAQAQEKHQFILLNFSGSDWCAPCIRMKREIFENPEFIGFADRNLVLVKADFPRHKKNQLEAKQKAHNEKLAEQYNPDGKFPLTILLDSNGKIVKVWDGFPDMTVDTFIKEIQSKTNGK